MSPIAPTALDSGFRLGSVEVYPTRRLLIAGDRVTHLEPKTMELLRCLAQGAGRVVPKEALLHDVWPGTFVSEVGLARVVSELRKGLGDDAKSPTFIETVPKLGYRLIPAPEPLHAQVAAVPLAASERRPARWFLPLMVAQLAAALWIYAAVPQAPSAPEVSNTAPEGARQLAYGHYLKARDLYRNYRLPDHQEAIAQLRQAITADPTFALAHAELASALVLLETRYQVPGSWLPEALAAAQRARHEQPALAEAHKALGMIRSVQGRHREAAAALTRALELRPEYPEALYTLAGELQCLGRLDESLALLARWSAMARLNPQDFIAIGIDYLVLGEFAEARAWLAATALTDPHQVDAQVALAQLDLKTKALPLAEKRMQQLLAVMPDCAVCLATAGDVAREAGEPERAEAFYRTAVERSAGLDLYARLRLGETLRQRDAFAAAEEHFVQVESVLREGLRRGQDTPYFHVFLATISGLRGDQEEALTELERALAAGWLGTRDDLDEVAFEGLKNDPRFQGLVARLEAEVERQRRAAPRLPLPEGVARGVPVSLADRAP